MNLLTRALPLMLLLLSSAAMAQSDDALPDWDRLTPTQREALVAPVRERWNAEPTQRARMLRNAQRWKAMTPGQRREARQGMHRFRDMSPQRRQEARALFEKMRALEPQERAQLRERWQTMSPEERKQWMQHNATPRKCPRRPPGPWQGDVTAPTGLTSEIPRCERFGRARNAAPERRPVHESALFPPRHRLTRPAWRPRLPAIASSPAVRRPSRSRSHLP